MQQAYEILGDEDKRRDYDLEVKAKKLKEELAKRGGIPSSTSAHGRYFDVKIRTAEPPPGFFSSKQSTSKSSPYKKEFSQSWESEIPSRSKGYPDDERRARRTASYEKPKRDDSRERRRRMDEDREWEKRKEREREEDKRKELKRQQKQAMKDREAAKDRERERRDRKLRDEREREAAKAKELKKMRDRERERDRERDREARRKPEVEDKVRTKAKPYLEPTGYSEDDDDVRRSRAKKSSSPKKQSDSPSRESPATKQRDRSNPRESAQGEEFDYHKRMAYAASYMDKIRTSKSSSRHTAEVPFSAAYPNPDEKFTPKRRASGEGKHPKDEPFIVDADPDQVHPEVVSPSSNTQQAQPRLHKSHTMPPGYMPQTQTAAPVPPRAPLNRAFTMPPEHEYSRPAEKHRSARRRMSFDEEEDGGYYQVPTKTTYHVGGRDRGMPRIIGTKYNDLYAAAPGVTFPKVKTAPAYGTEHVATSRRYEEDDVMTSAYNHMQPSYDYRTAVR